MSDRLQGSMIVLHGPPKCGKTQLVSKFPGPIQWFATELGHRYIPETQRKSLIQLAPKTGWQTFIEKVDSFPRGKKDAHIGTFALDTISGAYDLCMRFVGAKEGWEYPPSNDHGRGWSAVKREFLAGLSMLTNLVASHKATLVIIDHTKIDRIETTTEIVEKVSCSMPGQARGIVMPIPDHIWFLGYAEENTRPNTKDALVNATAKRALFIGGDNTVEAGCRDPSVKTKIIVPLSQNDPYTQIVKALYGETKNE